MKRRELTLLLAGLVLIGGTAGLLGRLKTHQRLGKPGVRTTPIPGSANLRILLPEKVLDYQASFVQESEAVTNTLPKDTSFGRAVYTGPGGFWIDVGDVLMGTDRTSIHKPQFCLTGQGWRITKTEVTSVPTSSPHQYDLPVIRLTTAPREINLDGRLVQASATYVYWFVADGTLSADPWGFKRMWSTTKHLLATGERHRWAYVACLALSTPGQENAVFERIRQFIAASAPEFQLTPPPAAAAVTARQ